MPWPPASSATGSIREDAGWGTAARGGKVVIKDRIADAMFQQILLRPSEYSVLAMPNLNGDYFSDACAAQIGGLGMAPGANIGDSAAIFEATHGTAPKYAGKDMVNPGSVILSGAMLLEYLGWADAARLIHEGVRRTIAAKTVTYDLERQMPGATKVSTSAFGAGDRRAHARGGIAQSNWPWCSTQTRIRGRPRSASSGHRDGAGQG